VNEARAEARTFVSLGLGAELGAEVAAEVESVLGRADFRLSGAAGLHLTLAFLGGVERARLPALAAALAAELAGLAGPQLSLSGSGAFPSLARPRVLWVGVEERAAPGRLAACRAAVLAGLARAGLAELGAERGVPAEGVTPHVFTPHVTVARPRGARSRVPEAFAALALAQAWTPAAVELCESTFGRPADRRYEVLARFPFLSPV
jgi:2'-5' RNA ligase